MNRGVSRESDFDKNQTRKMIMSNTLKLTIYGKNQDELAVAIAKLNRTFNPTVTLEDIKAKEAQQEAAEAPKTKGKKAAKEAEAPKEEKGFRMNDDIKAKQEEESKKKAEEKTTKTKEKKAAKDEAKETGGEDVYPKIKKLTLELLEDEKRDGINKILADYGVESAKELSADQHEEYYADLLKLQDENSEEGDLA